MWRRISRARSFSACTGEPPAGFGGGGGRLLPESGVVMAVSQDPIEREAAPGAAPGMETASSVPGN